jgi:hypothetical protein
MKYIETRISQIGKELAELQAAQNRLIEESTKRMELAEKLCDKTRNNKKLLKWADDMYKADLRCISSKLPVFHVFNNVLETLYAKNLGITRLEFRIYIKLFFENRRYEFLYYSDNKEVEWDHDDPIRYSFQPNYKY